MIFGGYDTDDLTDRQNYVFHKLYNNPAAKNNLLALEFLSYCVSKNFRYGEFDNYEGDCNYLFGEKQETLDKYGIDLNDIYN